MAEPVAIVGMAGTFPGAADVDRLWANVCAGVDAIGPVPADRWDASYYDPAARRADRFYCRRGGFLAEPTIDAAAFGVVPAAARVAEPDQLLALQAAAAALADAGCRPPRPERAGVILGRGGYLTPAMARLDLFVRGAECAVAAVRAAVPDLPDDQVERVRAAFQAQVDLGSPDAAIGLVPNLAASRIANRLDLRGPAYVVDAACASSLVAIDHACRELASRRCDVVLAGGVHVCHDVTFWSVFTRLGALSRSDRIRPFHRDADGLLIGEGVGVVVLKRLADAERDGDRVYAVIRGVGIASDGRASTVMTPRVDGQVMALERAYRAAGIDPASVGLIEAHGTATPAGDAAEIATMRRVFGDRGAPVGIGSIKSMIGHAMPAAGIAGLIKAALAVYHGVLPPTLHCDEPHPALAGSRLRPVARAEAWDAGVRRAGVSAFGFGGINAHVVLDQHAGARPSPRPRPRAPAAARILLVTAATPEGLARAVATGVSEPGPCRLALVDPTAERRARAARVAARGAPWRGRQDLWIAPGSGALAAGGKLAFVFPGIEPEFSPRTDDVAAHFGLPAAAADRGSDIERHTARLVATGRLLDAALRRLGVRPDCIAGHSAGEWTGMVAAEMIPADAVDAFAATLRPGSVGVADLDYLAVGCSAARAARAIAGIDGAVVSHDNCPHQAVVCGPPAAIAAAVDRLRAERVLCQRLPFRSGFHTPAYRAHVGAFRDVVDRLPLQPARIPLWSATTCAPYPDDPDAIRALAVDHLVEPVRFRELVDALYAAGVRVFVLVGPTALGGFIDDTLRGRPHATVAANSPRRAGLAQLARVAAALWTEGVNVRFDALPVTVDGDPRPAPAAPRAPVALALGAPRISLAGRIAPAVAGRAARPVAAAEAGEVAADTPRPAADTVRAGAGRLPAVRDPVVAAFEANLALLHDAQRDVLAALERARRAPPRSQPPPARAAWRHRVSLDDYPELADHTFYRQRDGWPHWPDRFPVVPMTMHIDLMVEAAARVAPGRVAVAVENVSAHRWLAVAPPAEVDISAAFDGADRVDVRIGDYAAGTVVVATTYPPAPAPSAEPIGDPRPPEVDAGRLYDDRWMFHGPAYRGVRRLGPIGAGGIRGELAALPARGALLDNAGQLMGYWVMANTEVDRLAFPVRIASIEWFAPPPAEGRAVDCTVWIRRVDHALVRADMELVDAGRLWARATGWVDKRFDTDEVVWPMLRFPERRMLSEREDGGVYVCVERWRGAASRELIARRYLGADEYAVYERLGARRQRGWLVGRIAAKDAVRDWLWRRGLGAVFPAEVRIDSDAAGGPVVAAATGCARAVADALAGGRVAVSIAHKPHLGVARLAHGPGARVGVDVETIAPRGDGFAHVAFTDGERRARGGVDRDEWFARVWAAKEAAAKAAGTGLMGNPRRFEVVEVAGDRMLVARAGGDRAWVTTRRRGDAIVAWTAGDDGGTPCA
ncbi:MAG: acyltransferase domain-containing protein [Deltaproteobacteria bacterium]|nr:MAG: acyltransferase domain-containing protein [Deltaproteobacteria bacterium]